MSARTLDPVLSRCHIQDLSYRSPIQSPQRAINYPHKETNQSRNRRENIPVGSSDDEIVASLDASATSKSEPIVEEVEDDRPDKTHSGETEGMTLKWMLDAWITTDH